MLPSSGYFRSIPCPFFKNGLCERHHCHYGHAKVAPPSGRSLLGRCLPDSNKDFLDKAEVSHSTISIEPTILQEPGVTYGQELGDLDYIPTPVDRCIRKAPSILKKSKPAKYPLTTVPEYRPTPISRLKPLGLPDSSEENSLESLNVSALSKKRKKVEEYDPTEVRCAFKKKVSFNLPEDDKDGSDMNQGESIPCVPIDSSDDELDITPQFSDDEEEEGHTSDDNSPPVIEIKEEKPDVMKLHEYDIDIAKICDFNQNQIEDTPPIGSTSEYKTYFPENKDFSFIDKVPVEIREATLKGVHKPSLKATATSTHVDSHLKSQKSHNSEVQSSQKNSRSSKEQIEEPRKLGVKFKQESHSYSVSHSRLKDEKLHKDGSKQHVDKKENFSKRTTSDKKKGEEPLVCSSKSSGKTLPEKKNRAQDQNKVVSVSEMHSEEVRNKSQKPKVKSEHGVADRKDRTITKHSDSLKSKSSERNSKSISKNKSKSHDKDTEKVVKAKDVKIQDEKVSSSCQASHKKHVTSEKRHSSSPTKKKPKLKSDEKIVVKPKSLSEVHISSQDSEFLKSEVKKNNDKEIQCNVQESLQDDSNLKSPLHAFSDSDEDVHFPSSDSDMDSDTLEECLRFFNEHEQSQAQKKRSFEEVKDEKKENMVALVKKRVAHQMALPKPKVPKLQPQVNPSQMLHNRFIKLQEMYARQNVPDEKKVPSAFVNSTSKGIETYKRRITIAPSADLVAAVTQKQKLLQSSGSNNSSLSQRSADEITYVVTETKRIARVPSQVMKPRPIIPVEYGCKVPSNVRQRYLNNFIDECLKFCSDEDEAYQTALDEEKRAYERSSNKTVYLGVAINVLKRLRNQAMEVHSTSSPAAASLKSSPEHSTGASNARMKNMTISHEMMLGGSRAQRTSFSIEKKKPKIQDVEIKGKLLYEALMSYVLNEEQLVENGFPLPHPAELGRAVVSGIYATKKPSFNDPFKRVCGRCQKSYQVDENSDYVKVEECEYHWGHLWQKRIGRSMERQYSCCGGDSQSDGCCIAPGHVFDGNDAERLKGYVQTMAKSPPPDGYFGVYALDCEMCYTSAGIELIRVTVINPEMKPVYESFVKPDNKILDYNTRFSGISEEHLANVETSLRDVQAVLLCLFNNKTILIGHSLESDFKALKLIHKTVVDTSVVFPHKRGLPYKRALRTLMAEYMRKIIQNSLEGHDSNEDAVACMELMLWKIKEDLKRTR